MDQPSPPTREQLLRDLGYSERSIRYIADSRNLAASPAFTRQTAHVGHCGDMLKLYLDVDGDRIRKATFELTGCAGLQACASGLTTMIEGMTLEEARRIEVDDIIRFLGGIPAAKWDCAELARDTLRKALEPPA
ncbi:MAG: iron-sulfur cluster assembly scaffold protein [Planctomycetes bacterium]|nr:iron-sulfur cluster assembly scaffold protein [Planctomycetota bacterium]